MIFVYRKRSGEVVGTSVNVGIDTTYFGSVVNPTMQDGPELVPTKIWTGAVLRNATAGEIAGFAAAASADDTLQLRGLAIGLLNTDAEFRKILRAIVGLMVQQLNILRANDNLAAITEAQAQQAIINAITNGTYD